MLGGTLLWPSRPRRSSLRGDGPVLRTFTSHMAMPPTGAAELPVAAWISPTRMFLNTNPPLSNTGT